MFETIVLCTIFGVFILIAYTLGLKNGQRLKENKTIELPKITETVKEIFNKDKNFEDSLSKEEQISWQNINNYDGTKESQKSIESR